MKVLLVDDHSLFREGLAHVLAGFDPEMTLLQAGDCTRALELVTAHPDLDLVLLDLNLPGMTGFEGLKDLCERFPTLPVVILSASTRRSDMQRALDLGAMGFIPKDATSRQMIQSLRMVQAGSVVVPEALVRRSPDTEDWRRALTGRQRDVLTQLGRGHSNKEIARTLDLAEATVKMHVTAIMKLLNVNNRTQAVLAAQRLHLDK
jgi:DNA-binding NarL/FixJ family response regulator